MALTMSVISYYVQQSFKKSYCLVFWQNRRESFSYRCVCKDVGSGHSEPKAHMYIEENRLKRRTAGTIMLVLERLLFIIRC